MERLKVKQTKTECENDRHIVIYDGIHEFRFTINENFDVLLHLTTSSVRNVTIADLRNETKITDLFDAREWKAI